MTGLEADEREAQVRKRRIRGTRARGKGEKQIPRYARSACGRQAMAGRLRDDRCKGRFRKYRETNEHDMSTLQQRSSSEG